MSSWTACLRCDRCHLHNFPLWVVQSMLSSTQRQEYVRGIHLVLDSYVEMSLKEGQRLRRRDEATGIAIIDMSRDTPIPKQLNKFWASEENKHNLQVSIRAIYCNDACANPRVASSVVSDNEALPAIKFGNEVIPELLNWIEEADARVVVHVVWVARIKQFQRVVVMSNNILDLGSLRLLAV
ncbi:hypothetical protein DPMN_143057 [Dreissena polymorpha]|uniref:Uncharacterized protein n=1 Tax=Dreissena polymorpha TaxID=45954 RepID=A0A9D4GCG4_DREPO|nr:hypothetical protein DPMN_143057 [Dreissena polymorpha]